jgi:GNAT superfamily N-acetyltransferase
MDATVRIRAIVPSDADNYRSILLRTSAEDRYCRFFHVVDHFDDAAVDSYVKASPDTIGLIAEKDGQALGVAHAFFIDEGCAETAFVVANDARHLGVGRLLFERLIAALQQRRCTSVIAYALAQNGAFSNLARSVRMQPGSSDGGIVTWTLSPAGTPPAESAREVQPKVWEVLLRSPSGCSASDAHSGTSVATQNRPAVAT